MSWARRGNGSSPQAFSPLVDVGKWIYFDARELLDANISKNLRGKFQGFRSIKNNLKLHTI